MAKSSTLDLEGAERQIYNRWGIEVFIPHKDQLLAAVTPYVDAHNLTKPDIWATRDVTFPRSRG